VFKGLVSRFAKKLRTFVGAEPLGRDHLKFSVAALDGLGLEFAEVPFLVKHFLKRLGASSKDQ